MNIVADTNTVVSGLLWHGTPRQVLNLARDGSITMFTSAVLLAELADVLAREKFFRRLQKAVVASQDLVLGYAALAHVVEPVEIQPVIRDDPDDNAVLACAFTCHADFIVSGDKHLLHLGKYRDILIITASDLLEKQK